MQKMNNDNSIRGFQDFPEKIELEIFKGKNIITNKTNNMEERELKITIDQAKIMLEGDNEVLKDIALKTFPELGKSKYPMSHDELQDSLKGKTTYYINQNSKIQRVDNFDICNGDDNRNIILSEQRAKEHLALIQLIALRDKWNEIDEFEVAWNDIKTKKYSIQIDNGYLSFTSFSLSFKTPETRDLFYETFKDLIEEAKNLI